MTTEPEGFKYKREVTLASLLIILILGSMTFLTTTNIRTLLAENPTYELILATGFEKNRLELIGRSPDPEIEYVKWRFEDIYVKSYIGTDLVSTSEWRLFNGTTQIKYRDVKDVTYNYTKTNAWIIEEADYFTDSYHTNYIGTIIRKIQIYPASSKEEVELITNFTNLRLQYLMYADNHEDGIRIDFRCRRQY